MSAPVLLSGEDGSPVSNDGRGLKRAGHVMDHISQSGSPVSNDGRGLKLFWVQVYLYLSLVRPSAMTGAD